MKTRFLSAIALALVAMVALSVPAFAAEEGAGTGTLTAQGDGMARMRGSGSVALSGTGTLYIQDFAGDASIEVSGKGRRQELRHGAIMYAGFDGTARVSGSQIAVSLSGKNIELQATGAGKFYLRGHGTYETDKGSGVWRSEGKVIELP